MHRNTLINSCLICYAVVTCASSSVMGGTFTNSSAMPVVDQGDVSFTNMVNVDTHKSYTDGGHVGTTFKVGSKPILIDAVSYYCSTATLASRNNTYKIRIGTISGTTFTEMASTAGILQAVDTVAPEWFTWTFDTPTLLAANTTYAVDVRMTASGGWSGNIPYYYRDKNQAYADGQMYTSTASPYDTIAWQARDLNFHINAEFPPPAGTVLTLK